MGGPEKHGHFSTFKHLNLIVNWSNAKYARNNCFEHVKNIIYFFPSYLTDVYFEFSCPILYMLEKEKMHNISVNKKIFF